MEGRDLAKSFEVPFFESSAKHGINVEDAFFELVRAAVRALGVHLHLTPPAHAGAASAHPICGQL